MNYCLSKLSDCCFEFINIFILFTRIFILFINISIIVFSTITWPSPATSFCPIFISSGSLPMLIVSGFTITVSICEFICFASFRSTSFLSVSAVISPMIITATIDLFSVLSFTKPQRAP